MFLGIDVGTSAVKSILIDERGDAVATASAPLSVSRPHPAWSEQNPDDWWAAAQASVLQLPTTERSAVQGIGLSGQMHGAVVLGEDRRPMRPAILWNDGRSASECIELQQKESAFLTHGANLVMPGFTAPKLLWLQRDDPRLFSQIKTVLLPKDFVRLEMTGELATDRSDGAGTLWMDVAQRTWHEPLLNACGLTPEHMPTLYDGPQVTGQLRFDVATRWGMSCVPVVAGGSDNAAGALGAGVLNDGDTLLSLGTSGVIFSACEQFRSAPETAVHAFCHALPDRWHVMSVMLSAASCLEWACKSTNTPGVDELMQLAQQANASDETVFLPYLSGERTPHNDAGARGVLFGMTHDTGAAEIANAVLEGVAFGMADGFAALIDAGAAITALSVIGGGARSALWGEILAAAINRPLLYRESATVGPALGAARLARFGVQQTALETVFAPPTVTTTITPNRERAAGLAAKQARFQTLYRSLKTTFAEAQDARE